MIFALVKQGKIINIIVVTNVEEKRAQFLSAISQNYDAVIDVTNLEIQPSIGWQYDGENFFDPNINTEGDINGLD